MIRSVRRVSVVSLVGALGALVIPACGKDDTPAPSGPILVGSGGHPAKSGASGQAGIAGSSAVGGKAGKTGAGGASAAGGSNSGGRGGTGPSAGTGALGEPGGGGAGGEAGEGGAGALGGSGGSQAGQGGAAGEAGQAGASGNEHAHVFRTITALYDAIDAATLVTGDSWSVTWTSDAHVDAGHIAGTLAAGAPSPSVLDQGPLPLKLFGASDWTAVSSESGTYSFDADGYPVIALASNASASDYQGLALNATRYGFRRFTRADMRLSQDMTGAADLSGVSFRLGDAAQQNILIGNHFVEVGGATMSVAFDYVTAGTQTLTGGQPASSTRVFDGTWSLVPASATSSTLTMTMALESLASSELGSDTADVPGQGDWSTDTGLTYAPIFELYRATGGSGTSSATAITFEVQRYEP
ncbi:MAG TPA: hypothetical protein VMI54_29640 [Polyangiaceae bacterium]|nr:hypothetical protein [Polyangiaceae bacterium]